MKFDPRKWVRLEPADAIQTFSSGRIRVRSSKPAVFFVGPAGSDHLVVAGHGHELDVTVSYECDLRIDVPKGAEIFAYEPLRVAVQGAGEIYRSLDLRPAESGSVLEVKRALRLQKLEIAQMLADARKAVPPEAAKESEGGAKAEPTADPEPKQETAPETPDEE